MLDREQIVAVLLRRFPGATTGQVAAAANAIIGLDDEWVEVPLPQRTASLCRNGCLLRRLTRDGQVKLFRRVEQDQ